MNPSSRLSAVLKEKRRDPGDEGVENGTDSATPRSRLPAFLALAALTISLALVLAWPFIVDPSRTAHTRDPAWYTWRTRLLLEDDPALLLTNEGPFGILTGGYRITTPVVGALLHRVAGIDLYRFTVLLEVGVPILVGLALGAFAYRHKRDPLALLLTMAVVVPLFMTVPFIGYMDNGLGLLFLALALFFVDLARESWGARSALFLLVFLAMLTHVPSTVVFGGVLALGAGIRLVAYRFSFRRLVRAEGAILVTVVAGILAGLAAWRLGIWGPGASLSEAAVPQPYTGRFFEHVLSKWLRGSRLEFVLPLLVAGGLWVAWEVWRRRSADRHSEFSMLAMLPLLGSLGFLLGLTYPYYRFINVTLGPLLLVGLGAWALTRGAGEVGRRIGDRWRLLPAITTVAILIGVGLFLVVPGTRTWAKQGPWITDSVRLAAVTAGGYASEYPGSPIVFVVHPKPIMRSWGLSKQATNIIMGALDGSQVARTRFFVGTVQDFLARRPTITDEPVFNLVSKGYLEELQERLEESSEAPVVFYLPGLNQGAAPPPEMLRELVPGRLAVVDRPGLAPVSEGGIRAAYRALQQEADMLSGEGSGFTVGHVARLALGFLLLLVIPGFLAARWIGVEDFSTGLALVPSMSLALCTAGGILVVAVVRGPFSTGAAWIAVGLACAAGAAAALVSRGSRRTRDPAT